MVSPSLGCLKLALEMCRASSEKRCQRQPTVLTNCGLPESASVRPACTPTPNPATNPLSRSPRPRFPASTLYPVTTQNIDDLHERGGSKDVAHLHGSLFEFRCDRCEAPYSAEIEIPDQQVAKIHPPTCPACGRGLIRPGVVWFGEALPRREWAIAEERMLNADAVLIVGTSGVVFPAAGLPLMAHSRGIPIVEVTPMRTDLSQLAAVVVEDTAANALPLIMPTER